jgi:hypothetical protein
VVLESIDSPADLKALGPDELPVLAEELRAAIIEAVSKLGGHLGSNLGVVELTLALHRVFTSPQDVLLWDTGHQAYVHKMLTGRRDRFDTLKQAGGLSGYPARVESEHDVIENSHASTALSWAFGVARGEAAQPVDGEVDSNANWISTFAITDFLSAISAKHVLVVADTCYAGALTRSALARLEAGRQGPPRGSREPAPRGGPRAGGAPVRSPAGVPPRTNHPPAAPTATGCSDDASGWAVDVCASPRMGLAAALQRRAAPPAALSAPVVFSAVKAFSRFWRSPP